MPTEYKSSLLLTRFGSPILLQEALWAPTTNTTS